MPTPPLAKKIDYTHRIHGHERHDPYFWMRSDDRSAPDVLAHLRAETNYASAVMQPISGFREQLYREIIARIPQDDATVPYREDGYYHYTRVAVGQEYAIHCRKHGSLDAAEEIVFDANREAEGHAYYATAGVSSSVDGRTLAYAEDTVSRRIYTIKFRNLAADHPDLERGVNYDESIPGTSGNLVWALDNRTLFYTKREAGTMRAYQVWRHELGTPTERDALVYEEADPEFSVGVARSRSRDYILIGSRQTLSTEYRVVDARHPNGEPQVVLPREANHEYSVDHAHGRFWIRTNWEARDFRLMSVEPAQSADKTRWRVEVPAREAVFLRGFELFADHLVLAERRDGIARLKVIPWADRNAAHDVAFDEDVYTAGLDQNAEFEVDTVRLSYTSMTTPSTVYDYNMRTRAMELKKRQRVEGDFDPNRYATERAFATARDGTRVPMSIVYRKDLDRRQPQPLWLYGYGSYGLSMDPTFSSTRLSLLDRGFVYVIAHIRGGQEMGRAWYEDGKLLHKLNTFYDFIDCAEHLIREGWTQPDRLFAQGGSAGGLLMGAVMNMRPELFAGVVANVPFVDVVTTMLDASIPLTTFEYDEWGNPNEEGYYRYMLRYSPYDNVSAQAYPETLVLTGLHDSQVQYWEPAKWVARLRERNAADTKVLFHVNMEAGHGGASGRFRRHKETALTYAWALRAMGLAR